MRGLVLVLGLVGCESSSDTGGSDLTESPPTEETGGGTTDTQTSGTEDISASLSGTISGPGGPLGDVDLRLCRGLACRNGLTDGSGGFLFDEVVVAWHSFEAVSPEGSTLATAFAPLQFATDQDRVVDLTLVEASSQALPATAAPVEVAPGVRVTVGQGELEAPSPFDPAPSAITGAAVPADLWVPTDGIAGTVLGQWFLGPFDTPASGGLPIAFDDAWSLADGTTLRVYVGSYEASAWLDAGTVTASGGSLSGDAELPLLSTVLLVQE